MREAVGELVKIIRELRPHVVVTYDPNGGYGHPDHIQTHRVTTAAVEASSADDYPGTPWQVPKFYWTVVSRTAMAAGLDNLNGVPDDWALVSIDVLPYDYSSTTKSTPSSTPATICRPRSRHSRPTPPRSRSRRTADRSR